MAYEAVSGESKRSKIEGINASYADGSITITAPADLMPVGADILLCD